MSAKFESIQYDHMMNGSRFLKKYMLQSHQSFQLSSGHQKHQVEHISKMKQKKLEIYKKINSDVIFKTFLKKCIIEKSYEEFMKQIVLKIKALNNLRPKAEAEGETAPPLTKELDEEIREYI